MLVEEKINDYNQQKENKPQEYETILIKYENDIRGHIKIEQQLKLLCESLQSEIEDLEKENEILLSKLNKNKKQLSNEISDDESFKKENIKKENKEEKKEKKELQLELKNTLFLLKKYEEQNLNLSNCEKKLKNLLIKKEKEYLENENKLKEEITILNKRILNLEEKNKKNANSGNISLHNYSNPNFFNSIKASSLTSYREDKNSNIHYVKNSSQSNRKNSSSSFSASASIDKIEKYLKNKYSKKNISNRKKTNNQILNYDNIKKEKIQNENIFFFNKNNTDFLTKLLMNETNMSTSNQKKKHHNRHKSLENSTKLLKKKHSAIFKEILMNSSNESKLKRKNTSKNINKNNFTNNKNCFEMVNNINIYTNTLKQDNNNVFYKPNVASNSYNSNQFNVKNYYK